MKAPWFILLLAIAVSIGGQALLKAGAGSASLVQQLFSPRTIFGLALYGAAALMYIVALRSIPLSVALPCTSVSYVAAVLIGHFVFGEPLTLMHLAAVGLIGSGVLLLAFFT